MSTEYNMALPGTLAAQQEAERAILDAVAAKKNE